MPGVAGRSLSGTGVLGNSNNGIGVRGQSTDGEGVYGTSEGLYAGVHGFSADRAGVWGDSTNDAGVYGTSTNGWAGYFNGKLRNSELAGSSGHSVCADSSGVLGNCASDGRLKRDVVPLAEEIDVLDALAGLRGVAFNWDLSIDRAKDLGEDREIGMIAQEVDAVLPYVVRESADGYKSLDYGRLTAFLIEVAKAQQAWISEQESRIQVLEARLDEMSSR